MTQKIQEYMGKKVYRLEELETEDIKKALKAISDRWTTLWWAHEQEYRKQHGDYPLFSIKHSVGFQVYVLYPKKRIPRLHFILQPEALGRTESAFYEPYKDQIGKMLSDIGIDWVYSYGFLD